MRIEIEIPDAKFNDGDVVKLESRGAVVFLLIQQRDVEGSFVVFRENGVYKTRIEPISFGRLGDSDCYSCAVQAGSFDGTGKPIRPGTVLYMSREEVDSDGEFVDWQQPVVPMDNIENYAERMTRHEAQASCR